MNYLNLNKFSAAKFQSEIFQLRIEPFEYLDGRNPRLPRKNSTKYKLRTDTKFYFMYVFQNLKTMPGTAKYKVEIIIYNGKDRLGGADLDNYCKAILDGVTATKKVWKDDKQVDELNIRRMYTTDKSSYIQLKIEPVKL
jgi:Holliday junction resolvase RusA-like endonuclease